jgi:hypothetical protein
LIYKGTLYAFYPSTDPVLFKESIDKISNFKGVTKVLPAHNELSVEVNLIDNIKNTFKDIEDKGMLKQGNGIFDFSEFKIHAKYTICHVILIRNFLMGIIIKEFIFVGEEMKLRNIRL